MEQKTNYQRVLGYYGRYKRALVVGGLAVVLSSAVKMFGPSVVRMAVDDMRQSVEGGSPMHTSLVWYGAMLLGGVLVQGLFLYTQRWVLIGMSRDFEYDIRNDFYAH